MKYLGSSSRKSHEPICYFLYQYISSTLLEIIAKEALDRIALDILVIQQARASFPVPNSSMGNPLSKPPP